MLEKPDLRDERVVACLLDEYALRAAQVVFLPIGADRDTAVYRVVADDQTPYFFKLRSGVFHEISVVLPKWLSDHGIEPIITPLETRTGQLWAGLDDFKVMLYPFVEGLDGYEAPLPERHWVDFGTALKRIHTLAVSAALNRQFQRETYTPHWRQTVKTFLERVQDDVFDEPFAAELAAFLKARRDQILDLVGRAEQLAQRLGARPLPFVLCHADLHAGNLLIGANGDFHIVDWDNPILAPKERDLMAVGGGLMGSWYTPRQEETLFYRGYGQTQIDPFAVAYYRYERIIQDIAVYCTDEGGEDREQSLRYLRSSFLPNGVLEIAYRSDQTRIER